MDIDDRIRAGRMKANTAARAVGERRFDPAGQQPPVKLIDNPSEQWRGEPADNTSPRRKAPVRPDKM